MHTSRCSKEKPHPYPALVATLPTSYLPHFRLPTSYFLLPTSRCSKEKPHPYPALVATLSEAIKKLIALEVHGPAGSQAAPGAGALDKSVGKGGSGADARGSSKGAGAPPVPVPAPAAADVDDAAKAAAREPEHRVVWCGMSHLDVSSEFKQRGGTEISPMSLSAERQVSEKHMIKDYLARQEANPKAEITPLLLKVRIDGLQFTGASLSDFSVFPSEMEVVYPPCTYLEPRSEKEEMVAVGNDGEELAIKIIEVVPQVP